MEKPLYKGRRNEPTVEDLARRLEVRALLDINTFDEAALTVTITMTTEAPCRMWDWELGYFNEILNCDKASIRAGRLNNGLPVLDNHNRYESVKDIVVGVVDSWDASNGKLTGVVKFSDREDLKAFIRDVQRGIIRNVSIGYRVYAYTVDVPPTETVEGVYRATDWEPVEVSFVPVGADGNATTRSIDGEKPAGKISFIVKDAEGKEIQKKSLNTNTKTQNSMTEEEIRAAEKQRCIDIHNAVKAAGLEAGVALKMIDENKTVDQAKAEILVLVKAATETTTAAKEVTVKEIGERNVAIKAAVETAKLPEKFALDLIVAGKSLDEARAAIIEEWAKEDPSEGVRSAVKVVKDGDEKTQKRFADALLLRSGAKGIEFSADERSAAREFMGRSFVQMCRGYFQMKGIDVNRLTDTEIARKALTDSDLPYVFSSAMNRSLRKAYELAPRTFTKWARKVGLADFRAQNRTSISDLMTGLEQINPGGDYPATFLEDGKEILKARKYGQKIVITWEMIKNDDLSAFARLPQAFADNAAYKQSDLVYFILLANPVLLTDGVALFHATHNNLTTGPGTAIDITSLGKMREKLREQTSPGNKFLNLEAKYLIVGPKNEQKAYQYTSSAYTPDVAANINVPANLSLETIVESRITGNDWFGIADNGRIDTVEFGFLDDEDEVYTEANWNFGNDTFEYKARMEFDAAPIDFRGMVQNTGA